MILVRWQATGLASHPSNSLAVGYVGDCGARQKQCHRGSQYEGAVQ